MGKGDPRDIPDLSIIKNILFEDNHILILNKPSSEIVQGDKTGDRPLPEAVKLYLKDKYNKAGNVFLGVVHRLDRPVSGAVIFAKTGKALSRLNNMLKERNILKIYWAVVKNPPQQESGHIVHYLKRNTQQNKSYCYEKEVRGSRRAELKFRLIARSRDYYLLEIDLLTGRHHQIRAQLSAIGCPIKGDLKYGFPRSNSDASIHLHSRSVEFVHPVSKEKITIIAPVPEENLWRSFESVISK